MDTIHVETRKFDSQTFVKKMKKLNSEVARHAREAELVASRTFLSR